MRLPLRSVTPMHKSQMKLNSNPEKAQLQDLRTLHPMRLQRRKLSPPSSASSVAVGSTLPGPLRAGPKRKFLPRSKTFSTPSSPVVGRRSSRDGTRWPNDRANTTIQKHSPELDPYWSAVLDAYGVAEQAHLWPAKQLLDYGNAILDSLRPGMVYVGGTDNGRWIPELLNDTSSGEQHIIITQNALADGSYAEYIATL